VSSLSSGGFTSCGTNFFLSNIGLSVFQKLGNDTSGDGLTSLSEGKALSLEDREGVHEFHGGGQVITGHGHGHVLGELDVDGTISSSDEALRSVAREERLGTTTFVGLEDIDLTFESSADLKGMRLGEAHSSLDLILEDTTEQDSDVVTSLGGVHLLVEGLNTGNCSRCVLSFDSNHVHILVDLQLTLFDGASDDTSSSSDTVSRINGHKEVLVHLTHGLLDGGVHRVAELFHGLRTERSCVSLKSQKGRSLDHDSVVTVVVVLGEKLSDFHLDELVHLFILDLIALVQEDDNGLDSDLSAEQDVLTGLRHGTISS